MKPLTMSNAEYHSNPALGSTSLKLGLIDPWTLWNRELFSGMPQTSSMILGSCTHEQLAILIDPETILEYTSNERGLGENTLPMSDLKKAKKMAHNVYVMFGHLLQDSLVEKSFFAMYKRKKNQLKVKFRPDYMNIEQRVIYDLKTIDALTDRKVEYAIRDYGYDISAAFYILVAGLCGIKIDRFNLIFVESTGRHLTKIHQFSQKRLDDATAKIIEILDAQIAHKNGESFKILPTII